MPLPGAIALALLCCGAQGGKKRSHARHAPLFCCKHTISHHYTELMGDCTGQPSGLCRGDAERVCVSRAQAFDAKHRYIILYCLSFCLSCPGMETRRNLFSSLLQTVMI